MSDGYRFTEFELLPRERLLLRDGSALTLHARAFDVLLTLVERSGQLVSKDELLARVWAGLIVEENNIAVQVAALRRVLGAGVISTISGVGYRFAAPVERIDADLAGEAAQERRSRLRRRPVALLGRDSEIEELIALLERECLVTIVGPAGVGKTLLAHALAQRVETRYRDGVAWVDLANLSDGDLIPSAVASACGRSLPDAESPSMALVTLLRTRRLVIVLDNAEHVDTKVRALCEMLLSETEHASVLVTSQVPLKALGEQVYRLESLAIPSVPMKSEDVLSFAAVQLFVERARGHDRHFVVEEAQVGILVDICRRLDGNALAIELAAARVGALGLAGLRDRLNERFVLLAPDLRESASRSNALEVAIDWSFGLLDPIEQHVFQDLALFAGGFTLEWGAALASRDDLSPAQATRIIAGLVERSLIQVRHELGTRYTLLETSRLYGLARLDRSDGLRAGRARHLACVNHFMTQAWDAYWGAADAAWRLDFGREIDNVRIALSWAIESDPGSAAALFGSSGPLFGLLHLRPEARRLAVRVADGLIPGAEGDEARRARFWYSFASVHSREFPGEARRAARQAADLYALVGDARGEFMALTSYIFNWRYAHADAWPALERARAIENLDWPAKILDDARVAEGVLEMGRANWGRALELYEDGLALSRRDRYELGILRGRINLADLALARGDVEDAIRQGEQLRDELRDGSLGSRLIVLLNLCSAYLRAGKLAQAWDILDEVYEMEREEDPEALWWAFDAVALVRALEGDLETAATIVGAADSLYQRYGQVQRQPNEHLDRNRLDSLLRAGLSEGTLGQLARSGAQMRIDAVTALAFEKRAVHAHSDSAGGHQTGTVPNEVKHAGE